MDLRKELIDFIKWQKSNDIIDESKGLVINYEMADKYVAQTEHSDCPHCKDLTFVIVCVCGRKDKAENN